MNRKNSKKRMFKNLSDDLFLGIGVFFALIGVIESMITHILPPIIYLIFIILTFLSLMMKKQL